MRILSFLLAIFFSVSGVHAKDWDKATADLQLQEGLLPVYTDIRNNKVYLAFPRADDNQVIGRYIYQTLLGAGLGSNPIGLDRGAGGNAQIILFKRVGDRVVAIVENHNYRATSDNKAERAAVEKAFAKSVIWAGDITAEHGETGRLLVDISSLLLHDGGIATRIKNRRMGNFQKSRELSFVETKETLAFPLNLEFEATLTFVGDNPGSEIYITTPNPRAVTLVSHTTLMALPKSGFKMREFDERAGMLVHSYVDMSAPLGEGVIKRVAPRFRLEKIHPDAPRSRVKKPIVFYVDNATPEPIRSALLEGANWWKEAFEEAGFIDAYRAEVLPEGVHPLDARYNVINWVHRATRGWSMGEAYLDPRTGEIMRGMVRLGSLRVRQDIKIFEGLAGTSKTGTGSTDDPIELALARVRQLAAHEVGHSLGFAHNMGASSYMSRASVMDYPAPLVHVAGDKLDFSEAYGVGIGPWDKWVVKYLYGEYASGENEETGQKALIAAADKDGLLYVKDEDSRPLGSGHVKGSLWDNGEDAVEGLKETIAVRRIALKKFGMDNLKGGERLSMLQDKIVPVYLYHRYQVEAAAKIIGGMEFVYGVKGDGRPASRAVSADYQQKALETILQTLDPDFLALDENLLSLLSPIGTSDGDPQFRIEVFGSITDPAFDYLRAAGVAADITLKALLHPARAERLVNFRARDDNQLGLRLVMDRLIENSFNKNRDNSEHAALGRIVQEHIVTNMITLANSEETSSDVRARVSSRLEELREWLEKARGRGALTRQHFKMLASTIKRFEDRQITVATVVAKPVKAPPGSPIGSDYQCWHCK